MTPVTEVARLMDVAPLAEVTHLADVTHVFGLCMLSIPLPKLDLLVDCTCIL